MIRKIPELLSPAGSVDVMKACYAAGADAVYMGLSRYSARAYAENASGESYEDAIRYAHRRGKKLYCTVNTLFKEEELTKDLYGLLAPLYEVGLDAVIVQDTGVIREIRRLFPDLPVHASTQMTVSGPGSVRVLQELGVKRVIPARELSLSELSKMKEETGIEIESFVHGALCYSYSGQCLFSSMAGGRSGNRGRCAQPCRMAYTVLDEHGKEAQGLYDGHVLSLKDLCALELLPEIAEAGVDSLKIEGRLKKAEYAAGVTSIYRKYLDLMKSGKSAEYRVSKADLRALYDLFNRQGFTEGYYRKQNGRDMLTLKEQDFRAENEALLLDIREKYIRKELKAPVRISYHAKAGDPLGLSASFTARGEVLSVTLTSGEPLTKAEGRPMTSADFEKQLGKLGGTDYYAEEILGEVQDSVFIPVSQLNDLRRQLVSKINEAIDGSYRRILPEMNREASSAGQPEKETAARKPEARNTEDSAVPKFTVLLSDLSQFNAVLKRKEVGDVILESTVSEADRYSELASRIREQGMDVYLALPQVFRDRARRYFEAHLTEIRDAGFTGFLVRSLDGLDFLKQHALPGIYIGDHTLYGTNNASRAFLFSAGLKRLTYPLELNYRELLHLDQNNNTLLVYGRVPMMVSANCIVRTAYGCEKRARKLMLRDRMGNLMPVMNECRYCMNTILNSRPVSLLSEREAVMKLAPAHVRIDLTVENAEETGKILDAFISGFLKNTKTEEPEPLYTKGHFRRGVE